MVEQIFSLAFFLYFSFIFFFLFKIRKLFVFPEIMRQHSGNKNVKTKNLKIKAQIYQRLLLILRNLFN